MHCRLSRAGAGLQPALRLSFQPCLTPTVRPQSISKIPVFGCRDADDVADWSARSRRREQILSWVDTPPEGTVAGNGNWARGRTGRGRTQSESRLAVAPLSRLPPRHDGAVVRQDSTASSAGRPSIRPEPSTSNAAASLAAGWAQPYFVTLALSTLFAASNV